MKIRVKIEYEAESDKDTALNLTNHAYFNLENAEQGKVMCEIIHYALIADFICRLMAKGIPNSPLKHVVNTSFDFRGWQNQSHKISNKAIKW